MDQALQQAVATHAFPGAVALVADRSGVLYSRAVGRHTYESAAPAMSVLDTVFDMASVTKVRTRFALPRSASPQVLPPGLAVLFLQACGGTVAGLGEGGGADARFSGTPSRRLPPQRVR